LIGRHHILSKVNPNDRNISSEYSDLDLIPAFFEEIVPFEEMIYYAGDFSLISKWIQNHKFNFSLAQIIQSFFIPTDDDVDEKESA
jgi:hypothetical protein